MAVDLKGSMRALEYYAIYHIYRNPCNYRYKFTNAKRKETVRNVALKEQLSLNTKVRNPNN